MICLRCKTKRQQTKIRNGRNGGKPYKRLRKNRSRIVWRLYKFLFVTLYFCNSKAIMYTNPSSCRSYFLNLLIHITCILSFNKLTLTNQRFSNEKIIQQTVITQSSSLKQRNNERGVRMFIQIIFFIKSSFSSYMPTNYT